MRTTILLTAFLLSAIAGTVVAQEKLTNIKLVDKAEADKTEAKVGDHLRVFGNREARKLGITFLSVRETLKELKSNGEIDGTEGNAELAVIVVDHLASQDDNKKAFSDASFDWDSLLAFIEKLIALIMKFFVI